MKAGRKIHEQIDEAIRGARQADTDPVGAQHGERLGGDGDLEGRKREVQENKRMLFPITIAPFDRVQEWEVFDADQGKIRRERFASITFRTWRVGKRPREVSAGVGEAGERFEGGRRRT